MKPAILGKWANDPLSLTYSKESTNKLAMLNLHVSGTPGGPQGRWQDGPDELHQEPDPCHRPASHRAVVESPTVGPARQQQGPHLDQLGLDGLHGQQQTLNIGVPVTGLTQQNGFTMDLQCVVNNIIDSIHEFDMLLPYNDELQMTKSAEDLIGHTHRFTEIMTDVNLKPTGYYHPQAWYNSYDISEQIRQSTTQYLYRDMSRKEYVQIMTDQVNVLLKWVVQKTNTTKYTWPVIEYHK